ncbi:MAG: phosphoglycerate dehydrogenase [bacterium]
MSPKIVVPDDFPNVLTGTAAERQLRALTEPADVTVFTDRGADQEAELIRRVGDAEIVLCLRAYARFSERVLTSCPRLRMISIWGTGTNNIDLDVCRARGVTVANTPGANANAVAEHTMALILAIARQIPAMDRAVRAGEWPRGFLVQLEGKTLGLIGFGAIGRRVAALAAPFGMRILISTMRADNGRAATAGATHVPLEALLAEADFVSLHLRLTPETEGFLGESRLALMKPTAFLINTARGALVDRSALMGALRGGLAGAALDVFHEEPIASGDPLLALPNVVLTPHNAGMTPEVIDAGLRLAVDNVTAYLRGAPQNTVV